MTKVLVSAPFNGGLFELDTQNGEILPKHTVGYSGTGLTVCHGQYIQAVDGCRFNVGGVEVGPECSSETNPWYHDLHYYADRDEFWAANVRTSQVDIMDRSFNYKYSIGPLVSGADKVFRACNWNSFCLVEHSLFGTAFALTNEHEGWREQQEGGVVFLIPTYNFQRPPLVIVSDLKQPHSLHATPSQGWLCNSIPGEFIIYQIEDVLTWTEAVRVSVKTIHGKTGFTRGVLRVEDGWLVGLSTNRHPTIFGFDDKAYTSKTAHVVHLDMGLKTINSWPMPFYEIYDIMRSVG